MNNSDYKLLIVDDDLGIRQSFVSYLEDSGFQVYDAANASIGLDMLEQFVPDLVITDLRMPGIDGLSFLKILHEKHPQLPVIVISGAGAMSDVVDALRLGATDYLFKPVVDLEVLEHSVYRGLERSHLLLENQRYREELEDANAQLRQHINSLEQDQQAGHFVQQSMLPVQPYVAHQYRASYSLVPSLFLSGDCIDYALFDKRYFAFYIADVSGHGSAPAFVTIWLKNLVSQLVRLRKLLADFDAMYDRLREIVQVINDELMAIHLNNHLTMIVGIIDTTTNELFYIVAGHLPLPILVTDSGIEYLPGSGKPVGLFEDCQWEVQQCRLPENCSVITFSDGILEILEGKDLLEKEQTLLQLLNGTDGSLSDISQRLGLEGLDSAPDDIAVLTINRSAG